MMKRILVLLSLLVGLLPIAALAAPQPPGSSEEDVAAAIRQAIQFHRGGIAIYSLTDTDVVEVEISRDGAWARAWLVPLDIKTGEVLPVEPGLALAIKVKGSWSVLLPSDAAWAETLQSFPEDLVPAQTKSDWLQMYASAQVEQVSTGPLYGYLLPWEKGKTVKLSRSVGHDKDITSGSAHFAFDFYVPQTMFPIHAAKAGKVKTFNWDCPNGNTTCNNWVLLEDLTTSPVTYQLYLHLAYDSMPESLRVVGAPVSQGQFVGLADDTGASSGHHLHFQVQNNISGSYWGTAIDIVFGDVAINGGRPRSYYYDHAYCKPDDVCDTFQDSYISGNAVQFSDSNPPEGDILAPQHTVTISEDQLTLEGWAQDGGSGIKSAQFKALWDNTWHNLGTPASTPLFSTNWNWCASGVPDGPVSLALELWDNAYNRAPGLPGLRHITKNVTCTPACLPGAEQIALFSEPDYQGTCVVLGKGDFTAAADFGSLGVDNAASVLLGGSAMTTLFSGTSLNGRAETFTKNDNNLADNRVGVDTVSSVKVGNKSAAPVTPRLVWPAQNAVFSNTVSLSLSWEDTGYGETFEVKWNNAETLPTGSQTVLHLDSLPPGTYRWEVRSRNANGASSISSYRNFTVQTAGAPGGSPVMAPWTDTMETTPTIWQGSSNWDRTDQVNHTPNGSIAWTYDVNDAKTGYDSGVPNAGDLTSPEIQIPNDGKTYYLRFFYNYETEGQGPYFDQRWVQLSINQSPFYSLFQLVDDPSNFWLQSPAIPLPVSGGDKIRVRFHFETLDSAFNTSKGWFIDDFTINAEPPIDCSDHDNTPAEAASILFGEMAEEMICPGGDVDYYRFSGLADQQIGAVVDAQVLQSLLDARLQLFAADGKTLLVENDDQVYTERTDSFLSFRLPSDGTYYIKVLAWDHPSGGSTGHTYRLRLYQDQTDPTASFNTPGEGAFIPGGKLTLTLSASDSGSGISHVQFLYHDPDWIAGQWVSISDDWQGSDGWTANFEIPKNAYLSGFGFYARVYDWGGNRTGTGVWNLSGGVPYLYLPSIQNNYP